MGTVRGIDVSSHQRQVDWRRIRAQGFRFAIAKATQGIRYRNPYFTAASWKAMREAGLIRGIYHYAEPGHGVSGAEEAAYFLEAVASVGGRQPGDLPLCLDIEVCGDSLRPQQIRRWCSDFCKVVHRETGREAITYTGAFWRDRVGALGPPRHGSTLWLSVYGPNDGRTVSNPVPWIPRGGFDLKIHQWTSQGRIDGVGSDFVDLNLWRGTIGELRALCRDDGAPARARARARARPRARRAAAGGAAAGARAASAPSAHDGPLSVEEVQQALKAIGWPLSVDGRLGSQTREALADFQRGYAVARLRVSGRPGPKTNRALRECVANGGRCSEHFQFKEFKSKGNGWIKVDRELVRGLERYRQAVGGAVQIVSAYRDPAHHASIPGAATRSQHLLGTAADIPYALSREQVRALRVFSGIGYSASTGRVRHVDVRHRDPGDITHGTVASPTEWPYAS